MADVSLLVAMERVGESLVVRSRARVSLGALHTLEIGLGGTGSVVRVFGARGRQWLPSATIRLTV